MSDFFLASAAELQDQNDQPSGCSLQPQLLNSDLDLIMLCDLESILTGNDWEVVFDRDYINPVAEQGPEGPWIYKVSSALLSELQRLSPESLLDCAQKWSDCDQWTLKEDTPAEAIADVLRELVGLAQTAGKQGKDIYIWTEL